MAVSQMNMKLLIDTKENRVLFAEAGKDFVDFLFSLLSLPVGTITRILTKEAMVGSLGNLYKSIENLNEKYIQTGQHKETFLNPKPPISAPSFPMLSLESPPTANRSFYKCNYGSNCWSYVAEDPDSVCPHCGRKMNTKLTYVASPAMKEVAGEEKGFVQELATYMVMDDLTVQPLSTICSITLLNKFHIDDLGVLEERNVCLGIDEGLKLLKASLDSKTVLTHVFLEARESKDIIL